MLLSAADLTVTKSPLPVIVAVGQPITSTITAQNNGPASSNSSSGNTNDVTVVDYLPYDAQFVSTYPPTGVYHPVGNFVSFQVSSLNPGDSLPLQVTYVPTIPAAVTDWATISSNQSSNPNPDDMVTFARPTAVPNPPAVVDLSVTGGGAYPSPVSTGSNVTFVHTVSNDGPDTATGVVVTDSLPPSYTYVSSSPGGTYDPASNSVIFNFPSLANAQSQTFQVMATANNSGVFADYVVARSPQSDRNETNNEAQSISIVHGSPEADIADMSVGQSIKNTPNSVGQSNTYNLYVQNEGPGTATGVIVSDLLPYGVTYQSSTPSGTYEPSTNTVVFDLGTLVPGAGQNIQVMVNGATQGQWSNRVLVRDDQANISLGTYQMLTSEDQQNPPQILNSFSSSPYTILPSPITPNTDIQVVTNVTPSGTVTVGQPLTYTFTVSNNGMNQAATNLILTDQIGTGSTFLSSSPDGTYYPDSGIVALNLGTIPAGQTATATVTVVPQAAGTAVNFALVRSDQIDTTPNNNYAIQTLSIAPAPTVQSLLRYGIHGHPATIAVTYNQPMLPGPAGDAANYSLIALGPSGRVGAPGAHAVPIRSVTYLQDQKAVLIYPVGPFPLNRQYELLINASGPNAVASVDGVPLLNNQTGLVGGQYAQVFNSWYAAQSAPYIPGSPLVPSGQSPLSAGVPTTSQNRQVQAVLRRGLAMERAWAAHEAALSRHHPRG